MSADLRGGSGDTPATGDQPHPVGQPHGADQRPVPPATDQAAGAEARRQKYAHLTEGTGQAPSRPDSPARHAGETGQAPSPEARQPHPQQKETRPPEARALTDQRYPSLEDHQKARNAAPPAAHTDHPQGTDKPAPAGKPPAADAAQGPGHSSGAERTGTHPYPEVPQQPPADPRRPADPGRQPGGTAITHLHFEGQDTSTDIYTLGSRTAVAYSPAGQPHLGPLDSKGSEPANGGPAALPHDVARYLSTGDRQIGIPVVGDRPDKSPGDTSDLPPAGDKLLERDDSKKSRRDLIWETVESPEVLDGLPDSTQQVYEAAREVLDARHPQGATVQAAPDSPHIVSPVADQQGLGNIAYAGVAITILGVELGRKIHGMLRHKDKG